MRNRAESIYHHLKEAKLYNRKLDHTVLAAVRVMDRGVSEDESIIALGKLEDDAERYTKIQNCRLVQDLCELEVPLRNRAKMSEIVENYKDMQVAETKRVNELIDNLEVIMKTCTNILELLR